MPAKHCTGSLMLFELKAEKPYAPIVFSKKAPVDGQFPRGAVRFGLGVEFGDEEDGLELRAAHRRLLKSFPVAHLLEEWDHNNLPLEYLIGEIEAFTGLQGYSKRGRKEGVDGHLWIRTKSTKPEKAPTALEVDF